MYFDAAFWSRFFEDSFARQIDEFGEVFQTRVLPIFANAEVEADEAAEREYDRLGSLPGGEDGPTMDMADAAELAQEAGLAHYEMLLGVQQGLLNLAAAGLYHMFEQQLMVFHRRQVLHPREEADPKLSTNVSVLFERLLAAGIALEKQSSWPIVQELKLVANTIKHGEGHSAVALREKHPRLLVPPLFHESRFETPLGVVSQPLVGEDVYVTERDFQRYRSALVTFWKEFGEAILDNQAKDSRSS